MPDPAPGPFLGALGIAGRIALAGFLGALIGFERETRGQVAGLRTHLIVAAASCLIMLVSLSMMNRQSTADPGRIAAQVVSGIGFLGAGAILRFGVTVRGLTTASSLWGSAAIGLAVGVDYYSGAVACTLVVLLALSAVDMLEKWLIRARRFGSVRILSKDRPGLLGQVENRLKNMDVDIKTLGIRRDLAEGKVEIQIRCSYPKAMDLQRLTRELSTLEGVEDVEIL